MFLLKTFCLGPGKVMDIKKYSLKKKTVKQYHLADNPTKCTTYIVVRVKC